LVAVFFSLLVDSTVTDSTLYIFLEIFQAAAEQHVHIGVGQLFGNGTLAAIAFQILGAVAGYTAETNTVDHFIRALATALIDMGNKRGRGGIGDGGGGDKSGTQTGAFGQLYDGSNLVVGLGGGGDAAATGNDPGSHRDGTVGRIRNIEGVLGVLLIGGEHLGTAAHRHGVEGETTLGTHQVVARNGDLMVVHAVADK